MDTHTDTDANLRFDAGSYEPGPYKMIKSGIVINNYNWLIEDVSVTRGNSNFFVPATF